MDVVVVSPLTSRAILGLYFLLQQQATIDLTRRSLHLAKRECNISLQDSTIPTDRVAELPVRCTETVEVPAKSLMQIVGTISAPLEGLWLLEEATMKRMPVAVARGLVEPMSSRVPLIILNPSMDSVTVYRGMRVATLQSVNVPTTREVGVVNEGGTPEVAQEKREMLWDLIDNSAAELSSGEKDLFYQLLLSYADVRACSTSDLGKTNKLQHRIPTGDTYPTRQPVRRFPPHQREEVQQLLNQMLDGGMIEPSTSPRGHPR